MAGAVMIVCVPPAEAEPDFVAAAKVKSAFAMALMLMVFAAVAPEATSAVIKKYPVAPEAMTCVSDVNDFAPAVAGVVFVLSVASPPSKVASVEYRNFKFVKSAVAYDPAVVKATVFSVALAVVTATLNLSSTCAVVPATTFADATVRV